MKVKNKILNFQPQKNVIPAKEMDLNLVTRQTDVRLVVGTER